MRSVLAWLAIAGVACGGKGGPPAAAVGPEAAVQAFNTALESGDAAAVRAQLASAAELAPFLDCSAALAAELDRTATELVAIPDVQAMRGRHAAFVGLGSVVTTPVPIGPFEGACKVTRAFATAKVVATWKLDGEPHTTRLTLVKLDDRWRVFDLPGL